MNKSDSFITQSPDRPSDVSPALVSAMRRADALSDWFTEHQPQFDLEMGQQAYAAALLSIALDHRAAVLLLLRYGARSSAFALARSIYEAYLRGVWMRHCATPADLANMSRNVIPRLERVSSELDKLDPTRTFGSSKRNLWGTLSDYSHGGVRQMTRWLRGDAMTPSHSDLDCVDLLAMVDLYGFQCSMEISSLWTTDLVVYAHRFPQLKADIQQLRTAIDASAATSPTSAEETGQAGVARG